MKRFAELPADVLALWAKSGEPAGHSLVSHMLDVAAVAESILLREPPSTLTWAAQSFGIPRASVARWLSTWVGLHDLGKATPGFQYKWPQGQATVAAAGLPFSAIALSENRHDLSSVALLARMVGYVEDPAWRIALAKAVGAHHGYVSRSGEAKPPPREGAAWHEARAVAVDAYWQTLAPQGQPTGPEPTTPAVAWLAGLTSVADWIGSNVDWFPFGQRGDLLTVHHARACELAEAALDTIGWTGQTPLLAGVDAAVQPGGLERSETDALICRVLGVPPGKATARNLQFDADRLLATVDRPALLLVEAPMGEGKTELAFLAHLRLQAANQHRGLYVALPTQATGNAMFERALTFLRAFKADVPLEIQLVHGAASLDDRVLRLRGVDHSSSESITSSAWFSQRRRPLLAPYGVGTVDQALFATLNVKHHFVRMWGLTNRVVVLDEVHAYDTYTSGLIEALLKWLKAMHCSVVLMSATLPHRQRKAFLHAWGSTDVPDLQYPRVIVSTGQAVRGVHVECRELAPVEVTGIPSDLQTLADRALAALAGLGCGVVIVNTVQRAQDLFAILRPICPADAQLLLFHARYPADERSRRENEVVTAFGCGAQARRPVRALLVATQVVEQSLDLDFDFMISDLAPVDLLLQRSGRLHRHRRPRPPAHAIPRLNVAGLLPDTVPDLNETRWGYVYDPYVLYCTWDIARREPIWRMPEDIDRLVQAVYAHDPEVDGTRGAWTALLDEALGKHLAAEQEQRRRAVEVTLDAAAEPQHAYAATRANEAGDGEGPQVVTRLGPESLTVVPILVEPDGWRLLVGDRPFDPSTEISDATARRIVARQLRLSRRDVVVALKASPLPKGFERHPLLRNLRPLLLQGGIATFDRVSVRLDGELGAVYVPTASPSRNP